MRSVCEGKRRGGGVIEKALGLPAFTYVPNNTETLWKVFIYLFDYLANKQATAYDKAKKLRVTCEYTVPEI